MVFKGCPRCSGDLWVEEDLGLRFEDLVCLQCGHRQAARATGPGLSVEDLTRRGRPAPDRRSRTISVRSRNGAPGVKRVLSTSQPGRRSVAGVRDFRVGSANTA